MKVEAKYHHVTFLPLLQPDLMHWQMQILKADSDTELCDALNRYTAWPSDSDSNMLYWIKVLDRIDGFLENNQLLTEENTQSIVKVLVFLRLLADNCVSLMVFNMWEHLERLLVCEDLHLVSTVLRVMVSLSRRRGRQNEGVFSPRFRPLISAWRSSPCSSSDKFSSADFCNLPADPQMLAGALVNENKLRLMPVSISGTRKMLPWPLSRAVAESELDKSLPEVPSSDPEFKAVRADRLAARVKLEQIFSDQQTRLKFLEVRLRAEQAMLTTHLYSSESRMPADAEILLISDILSVLHSESLPSSTRVLATRCLINLVQLRFAKLTSPDGPSVVWRITQPEFFALKWARSAIVEWASGGENVNDEEAVVMLKLLTVLCGRPSLAASICTSGFLPIATEIVSGECQGRKTTCNMSSAAGKLCEALMTWTPSASAAFKDAEFVDSVIAGIRQEMGRCREWNDQDRKKLCIQLKTLWFLAENFKPSHRGTSRKDILHLCLDFSEQAEYIGGESLVRLQRIATQCMHHDPSFITPIVQNGRAESFLQAAVASNASALFALPWVPGLLEALCLVSDGQELVTKSGALFTIFDNLVLESSWAFPCSTGTSSFASGVYDLVRRQPDLVAKSIAEALSRALASLSSVARPGMFSKHEQFRFVVSISAVLCKVASKCASVSQFESWYNRQEALLNIVKIIDVCTNFLEECEELADWNLWVSQMGMSIQSMVRECAQGSDSVNNQLCKCTEQAVNNAYEGRHSLWKAASMMHLCASSMSMSHRSTSTDSSLALVSAVTAQVRETIKLLAGHLIPIDTFELVIASPQIPEKDRDSIPDKQLQLLDNLASFVTLARFFFRSCRSYLGRLMRSFSGGIRATQHIPLVRQVSSVLASLLKPYNELPRDNGAIEARASLASMRLILVVFEALGDKSKFILATIQDGTLLKAVGQVLCKGCEESKVLSANSSAIMIEQVDTVSGVKRDRSGTAVRLPSPETGDACSTELQDLSNCVEDAARFIKSLLADSHLAALASLDREDSKSAARNVARAKVLLWSQMESLISKIPDCTLSTNCVKALLSCVETAVTKKDLSMLMSTSRQTRHSRGWDVRHETPLSFGMFADDHDFDPFSRRSRGDSDGPFSRSRRESSDMPSGQIGTRDSPVQSSSASATQSLAKEDVKLVEERMSAFLHVYEDCSKFILQTAVAYPAVAPGLIKLLFEGSSREARSLLELKARDSDVEVAKIQPPSAFLQSITKYVRETMADASPVDKLCGPINLITAMMNNAPLGEVEYASVPSHEDLLSDLCTLVCQPPKCKATQTVATSILLFASNIFASKKGSSSSLDLQPQKLIGKVYTQVSSAFKDESLSNVQKEERLTSILSNMQSDDASAVTNELLISVIKAAGYCLEGSPDPQLAHAAALSFFNAVSISTTSLAPVIQESKFLERFVCLPAHSFFKPAAKLLSQIITACRENDPEQRLLIIEQDILHALRTASIENVPLSEMVKQCSVNFNKYPSQWITCLKRVADFKVAGDICFVSEKSSIPKHMPNATANSLLLSVTKGIRSILADLRRAKPRDPNPIYQSISEFQGEQPKYLLSYQDALVSLTACCSVSKPCAEMMLFLPVDGNNQSLGSALLSIFLSPEMTEKRLIRAGMEAEWKALIAAILKWQLPRRKLMHQVTKHLRQQTSKCCAVDQVKLFVSIAVFLAVAVRDGSARKPDSLRHSQDVVDAGILSSCIDFMATVDFDNVPFSNVCSLMMKSVCRVVSNAVCVKTSKLSSPETPAGEVMDGQEQEIYAPDSAVLAPMDVFENVEAQSLHGGSVDEEHMSSEDEDGGWFDGANHDPEWEGDEEGNVPGMEDDGDEQGNDTGEMDGADASDNQELDFDSEFAQIDSEAAIPGEVNDGVVHLGEEEDDNDDHEDEEHDEEDEAEEEQEVDDDEGMQHLIDGEQFDAEPQISHRGPQMMVELHQHGGPQMRFGAGGFGQDNVEPDMDSVPPFPTEDNGMRLVLPSGSIVQLNVEGGQNGRFGMESFHQLIEALMSRPAEGELDFFSRITNGSNNEPRFGATSSNNTSEEHPLLQGSGDAAPSTPERRNRILLGSSLHRSSANSREPRRNEHHVGWGQEIRLPGRDRRTNTGVVQEVIENWGRALAGITQPQNRMESDNGSSSVSMPDSRIESSASGFLASNLPPLDGGRAAAQSANPRTTSADFPSDSGDAVSPPNSGLAIQSSGQVEELDSRAQISDAQQPQASAPGHAQAELDAMEAELDDDIAAAIRLSLEAGSADNSGAVDEETGTTTPGDAQGNTAEPPQPADAMEETLTSPTANSGENADTEVHSNECITSGSSGEAAQSSNGLSEAENRMIEGTDIDPAVLLEMPSDMRMDIIAAQRMALGLPARPPVPSASRASATADSSAPETAANPEYMDPEFLAALPDDLRAEVEATHMQSTNTAVPQVDEDFFASLPDSVRREHFLAASEADVQALPERYRQEASDLRQRMQRRRDEAAEREARDRSAQEDILRMMRPTRSGGRPAQSGYSFMPRGLQEMLPPWGLGRARDADSGHEAIEDNSTAPVPRQEVLTSAQAEVLIKSLSSRGWMSYRALAAILRTSLCFSSTATKAFCTLLAQASPRDNLPEGGHKFHPGATLRAIQTFRSITDRTVPPNIPGISKKVVAYLLAPLPTSVSSESCLPLVAGMSPFVAVLRLASNQTSQGRSLHDIISFTIDLLKSVENVEDISSTSLDWDDLSRVVLACLEPDAPEAAVLEFPVLLRLAAVVPRVQSKFCKSISSFVEGVVMDTAQAVSAMVHSHSTDLPAVEIRLHRTISMLTSFFELLSDIKHQTFKVEESMEYQLKAAIRDACGTVRSSELWGLLSRSFPSAPLSANLNYQSSVPNSPAVDAGKIQTLLECFFMSHSCLGEQFEKQLQSKAILATSAQAPSLSRTASQNGNGSLTSVHRTGSIDSNLLSPCVSRTQSFVGSSSALDNQAAEPQDSSSLEIGLAVEQFLDFVVPFKASLNAFVKQQPQKLNSSLKLLQRIPRLLDFENKRAFFKREVKRLASSRGWRHQRGLRMTLNRDNVLEESFKQLAHKSSDEWRGGLHIKFQGEEGIDAGGLTREWYSIVVKALLNPVFGLFQPSLATGSSFQPNAGSSVQPNHLAYFKFAGRLFAKSLCDGVVLDAHLSRAMYKHLLKLPISISDVEDVDTELYKSLRWLLDNSADDMDLYFEADNDHYGERVTVELQEGGSNIAVNNANKAAYVKLMAKHRLTSGIKDQVESFSKGFWEILPFDLVSIMSPSELELLMCGMPNIDKEDMRANTEYRGYSAESEQIRWFWSAVNMMEEADLAKLVQFITGTSQVPLDGFANLQGMHGPQKLSIVKASDRSDHLPTAHTCFNQLDLPEYETFEQLQEMLMIAVREGNVGFGFG